LVRGEDALRLTATVPLGRPEQVFGLVHPDLPGEFPPLRSLANLSNNVPLS
jgi:hypothetical protein